MAISRIVKFEIPRYLENLIDIVIDASVIMVALSDIVAGKRYRSKRMVCQRGYRTNVEGDNPTIGIVLCSDTDEDIARYSVMHGNEQLFASKYKLYLPTEEELKAEIEAQKAMFYLKQQENKDW